MALYYGKETSQDLENRLKELRKSKINSTLQYNDKIFHYSVLEDKIYEDKEAYRKIYFTEEKERFPYNCVDLIYDYYDLSLKRYLNKAKAKYNSIYIETFYTKEFIKEQKKEFSEEIEAHIEAYEKAPHLLEHRKETALLLKRFVSILDEKKEHLKHLQNNKSLINKRVQNLFRLIDFFHSNIDNFKSYDSIIQNLYSLDEQRNTLKPEKNFNEKLKYDEVQNELEQKFNIINNNIIQKIKEKIIKFDICDWNETNTIWSYNISDIRKLKENFTTSDVHIILKQKQKYIEFREKTNCNYFQPFFFSDMDKALKELFDYFKVSDYNEFENFETKTETIKVNSLEDALHILKNDKNGKFEIILNSQSNENEKQPQQSKTQKPDEVKEFEFTNNFDRVNESRVYNFFKSELLDKKYLTKENLQNFLKLSFEHQTPPKTKFNFEKRYLIKDIRKIFYKYFNEINFEKYNTQDKYIRLLTDYFEGFEFEKIKMNFNK